jgi:hypothetical protein
LAKTNCHGLPKIFADVNAALILLSDTSAFPELNNQIKPTETHGFCGGKKLSVHSILGSLTEMEGSVKLTSFY